MDCEDVIRPRLQSISNRFEIEKADEYCRIVTPFKLWNGDNIILYVQSRILGDNKVRITDRGQVFAMLDLYGVDARTGKRDERVQGIKDRYDLSSVSGEIALECPTDDAGDRILDIIQSANAIGYLVYTHQESGPKQFSTLVGDFLKRHEYDFEKNYKVNGETMDYEFNFAINSREPNVLMNTIYSSNKAGLRQEQQNAMLGYHETKGRGYDLAAVVDNVHGIYNEEILNPVIQRYNHVFKWDENLKIVQEIPARV